MFLSDLSVIVRYGRVYFERSMADQNIGFTEHLILIYLNKSDTVNQETIAKHFQIDKGAIAKTLNKLEEKQLILRIGNPRNKREKLISISDQGKNIIGSMGGVLDDWCQLLFEGLKKEEIEQFTQIVRKISANAVKVIDKEQTVNEDAE